MPVCLRHVNWDFDLKTLRTYNRGVCRKTPPFEFIFNFAQVLAFKILHMFVFIDFLSCSSKTFGRNNVKTGQHSFAYQGPVIGNELQHTIWHASVINSVKTALKPELFPPSLPPSLSLSRSLALIKPHWLTGRKTPTLSLSLCFVCLLLLFCLLLLLFFGGAGRQMRSIGRSHAGSLFT